MNGARDGFRSGFVALAGRPNVGKSTLLNRLVGTKLAIMSDKPQTTRNKVIGVLHRPEGQIVFLDTPGLHKPFHKLGEYMVKTAERAIGEVDLICFVVSAATGPGPLDREAAERIFATAVPVCLVINQIDLSAESELGEVEAEYRRLGDFRSVQRVSATMGYGVGALVDFLLGALPEGPRYFPEDMVTDQPETFVISEFIREKVLHFTREEVPHSIAVAIEEMKERDDGTLYVRAVIYVERESQKGIIVGARGTMIREVGKLARQDIEALLGTKVFLDLWVKVRDDWRNRPRELRNFGYDLNA